MRFIKAVCVALGAVAVPSVADASGGSVRAATAWGTGESSGEACAVAREGTSAGAGETVISIGACSCGASEDGWWTCSVVYKVRKGT